MTIKIIPNDKGNPPGKLADAAIHFHGRIECDNCHGIGSGCHDCRGSGLVANPLDGLKLIGFSIWERRGIQADREGTANAPSRRNVTFPARQYSVNGERRALALLRPIVDATAQDRVRALILDAYAQYETQAREATA